jgi:hypothetical protein
MGQVNGQANSQQPPDIVPPPPAAGMLAAGSAAGAHPVTGATRNGGQVQPVGRPFPGAVFLKPGRPTLEEPERANAVPAGGVGEPDADLGETLPKIAFFGRPGFPAGLEYLVGGEGPARFHQAPGPRNRPIWPTSLHRQHSDQPSAFSVPSVTSQASLGPSSSAWSPTTPVCKPRFLCFPR